MFQFRRFPTYDYLIHHTLPCGGFPHSEISGSQLICSSPKLIAAYHVLHRLLMPRHSPCALLRLTFCVARAVRRYIFGQTFQSWSNFLVLLKFELYRLHIGSVFYLSNKIVIYPNVSFFELLFEFLTVAFSSHTLSSVQP